MLVRLFALASLAGSVLGQQNGKLQIHFMDVGQGDGAVLISPAGEIVLFDNGVKDNCDKPVSYLQQLGVSQIHYHIASHYHADHIGCTTQVLTQFPLRTTAFDSGQSYPGDTYGFYLTQVGGKRKTAETGSTLTLEATSPQPVRIQFVALNGHGHQTRNENDRSVVALVRYGKFEAVIAGDLSGADTDRYRDIETHVAPKVGQVEVYKVNHHGSAHSSNTAWLAATQPKIGVISAGDGNPHGHPTAEALERLHEAGVKTYWTNRGSGVAPVTGQDVVGGNIIVEVDPGANAFTVTYSGTRVDTYPMWGEAGAPPFSWSKRAQVYHHASCRYVANISPQNFQQGTTAPAGKTLHIGCPR